MGVQGGESPDHSSNPPTLTSGQPGRRLAPCSKASVSSSHAHRATASSPPRMDPRTSSCMYLSESPPPPLHSWLGPYCRVLARPLETPLQACTLAGSSLCPWHLSPPVAGAAGAWEGEQGKAGPGGEGTSWPQKPRELLAKPWDPASRALRGRGQPLGLSAWKVDGHGRADLGLAPSPGARQTWGGH